MNRKILHLGALVGLAALSLTACSSADNGSAESADGKVTLTVATFNEFGYNNLFAEYMKSHPNIKVVEKKAATSNEAHDNMMTRLAAGNGLADIEAVEVDWWPELMQYPDQLTDLKSDATQGRWLDWKAKAATTSDGKLLGAGTDAGPEAICYRADLFQKAGLPSDRDEVAKLLEGGWDKYFAVGKKFVDSTGIPWYDGAVGTYQGIINQVEEPFEKKDNTVIELSKNKQIKGIYDKLITESVDNKLSAHLAQWSEDWTNAFQKDGFATMLCPPWMLGVIEGNASGVKGWDIAPVFPGGGGNWGGSYLTVPTQGKHVKEAKELAQWLTAPEQQIKAFKTKGNFPSQVKALESADLTGYTNKFFNDAPVGKIYSEMSKKIEIQPYKGPNFFPITSLVTDALNRVDVDKTDKAEPSWKKALSEYKQLDLQQ